MHLRAEPRSNASPSSNSVSTLRPSFDSCTSGGVSSPKHVAPQDASATLLYLLFKATWLSSGYLRVPKTIEQRQAERALTEQSGCLTPSAPRPTAHSLSSTDRSPTTATRAGCWRPLPVPAALTAAALPPRLKPCATAPRPFAPAPAMPRPRALIGPLATRPRPCGQ